MMGDSGRRIERITEGKRPPPSTVPRHAERGKRPPPDTGKRPRPDTGKEDGNPKK